MTDAKPAKVILWLAYTWDCPSCKSPQFAEDWPLEYTPEERRRLMKRGIDVGLPGNCVTEPPEVICDHCGETFSVDWGE